MPQVIALQEAEEAPCDTCKYTGFCALGRACAEFASYVNFGIFSKTRVRKPTKEQYQKIFR